MPKSWLHNLLSLRRHFASPCGVDRSRPVGCWSSNARLASRALAKRAWSGSESRARVVGGAVSLALLLIAPGCGSVMYTANILGAQAALEEARLSGAERLSPYEYYYARACAEKAREEAGDAEYQHAVELADQARSHAIQARDRARSAGGTTALASDTASGRGDAR